MTSILPWTTSSQITQNAMGCEQFNRSISPLKDCRVQSTPALWHPIVGKRTQAFTLIELLVVISIIGVLASLIMPSLTSIFGGYKINIGIETLNGALSSARQLAATKDRDIEFRLIEMKDPAFPSSSSQIRAIQLFEAREQGLTPIGKVRMFPSGIIISSTASMTSLCDPNIASDSALANIQPTSSDPEIPGVGRSYKYRSFRFRPDGSLNLKILLPSTVTNYFLTIYDEKFQPVGTTPPHNFATIQLEPETGANVTYRP